MKYIESYNDLLLEELFVESIMPSLSLNLDYFKDVIKKKKDFIPIDFGEIEKEAEKKGKVIHLEPIKSNKPDKKTLTDYFKYEKLLKKKLENTIKTPQDVDNYLYKIVNTNKFEKNAKMIVAIIALSFATAMFTNYKISDKIAKDKEAKEILTKLQEIEDNKLYSNDPYSSVELKTVNVLDISPNIKIFMDSIGQRESGNDPTKVNSLGYIGKYQFHDASLKESGFKNISRAEFMKDPTIWPEKDQDLAMLNLLKRNKHILRNYIDKYDGKTVGGIKITESGILGGAHLGGAGSVKDFLDSNGEIDAKDAYGTKVSSYLNKFSGYNLRGLGTLKTRPKSIKL